MYAVAEGDPASETWQVARAPQSDMLREVFGNPFRAPLTPDADWLTSDVVSLAEAIYDEQAFDRMPVLGDALEEAGCTEADILAHCREPGEHLRGCWVLDTILMRF